MLVMHTFKHIEQTTNLFDTNKRLQLNQRQYTRYPQTNILKPRANADMALVTCSIFLKLFQMLQLPTTRMLQSTRIVSHQN
jgi:hypothetical protein